MRLISSASIFSDTAITRGVAQPVDIFLQVGMEADSQELLSRRSLLPADFVKSRVEAETLARRTAWESHGYYEVTFSEIYSHLEKLLNLEHNETEKLQAMELGIERLHATRNAFIAELYNLCTDQGKRVGFVSDIYHERQFIVELLGHTGYSDYAFLAVSSEYRATKASGSLYSVLIEEWGLDPSRWLHIGDNLSSDCTQASKAGLSCLHYPKCMDRLQEDQRLRDRLEIHTISHPSEADKLAHSHLSGLIAGHLCSAPSSSASSAGNLPEQEESFWRQWGYEHVGPLILGFSSWLVRQILEEDLNHIYFLSRDGHFIQRVFDRIVRHAGDTASGIQSHYLYASRRAFNLPAIESLEDSDLEFLVSGTSCLSVREFLSRIDLSADEADKLILQAGFRGPDERVRSGTQYQQLRNLFLSQSSAILDKAAQEFEVLAEYFSQEEISNHPKIAIVDLGWHGSLQSSLDRLLRRMKSDSQVLGYYLGTFPPAEKHIKKGLDIRAYLCNQGIPVENFLGIRLCVEIYEWIFSAPHGTVCGFRREGGKIIPSLEEQEIDRLRWQKASSAQQGAMLFVEDYLDCQLPGAIPCLSPELSNRMMRRFLEHPTYQEAVHFGDLQHAEGFGSIATPRYIARPSHAQWDPRHLLRLRQNYRSSFWRNGYLKRTGLLPAANLARASRNRLRRLRGHGA